MNSSPTSNPYEKLVGDYARSIREARDYPNGGFAPCPSVNLEDAAPVALIFSPHPDDECIVSGLPLRLLRESGVRIKNVAVTQGSNPERQMDRLAELQAACDYIGFELIQTASHGLENINSDSRSRDLDQWFRALEVIETILIKEQPACIFFPHDDDWNSTHIGTHLLVLDAMKSLGEDLHCVTVETEYWGAMKDPNLMVESSEKDVIDMVTGTSFHVGEVTRNPFHILQPAWMQDNVRRGSELVGGQGGPAPDFVFATLYRARKWSGTQGFTPLWEGGRTLSVLESPNALLGL